VCHEGAAACGQSTGHDECSQLPPHSILPVEMLLTPPSDPFFAFSAWAS
jgi:hypothetical protein